MPFSGLSDALGSRSSGFPSEACSRLRRRTRACVRQYSGMSPDRTKLIRLKSVLLRRFRIGTPQRLRPASVLVAAIASLALGGCGGDEATLRTFAGGWQAHARSLNITRTGDAHEWLSLGMSDFVAELRFHLSRPSGTAHEAAATATVTAVRIGDRSVFTQAHPPPRVGQSFRIRLRDGVITEPLTGANYCGPGVEWPNAGCGA